ncbi:MAG: YggS family pyridoxal phosphate-dependent enzyme [bacterium]
MIDQLRANLESVTNRIAAAAKRSGRPADAANLVAVTKRTPDAWAHGLVALGQHHLGENYPQELWKKAESLANLPEIRWHAIGHMQSNKLKRTLPLVTMIHAVDSLDLLAAIGKLMPLASRLERVCLQVNMSGEASKHGWDQESILNDAEAIAGMITQFGIPVTGLMTMAALGTDAESARPAFAGLRQTAEKLAARIGRPLPDLSMGMSGDFESAIEEGATFVRVGSLLFEGLQAE